MRILITNDDGIFAPGIAALVKVFSKAGHTITVCAPDVQRSAAGHSIILDKPLCVKEERVLFAPKAYSISGTPADCVRLGLRVLARDADFVLSGINHGYNAGTDVLYSGTVAAAMEAALSGTPAMAVSLGRKSDRYENAAFEALHVFDQLAHQWPASGKMVNLNIPESAIINGIKATKLRRLCYNDYYECIEKKEEECHYSIKGWIDEGQPFDEDDYGWLRRGYATVSVLTYDMESAADTRHLSLILEKQ